MSTYLLLAGLLVAAIIIRRTVRHVRQNRLSRALGCKPMPWRPNRLPLGIDFLQDIFAADKADAVPIHFEQVAEQMSPATTWRSSLFGSAAFYTIEPTNVKAILATQFKDFDLGPRRQGCFAPLFAHGIFSDDGERWERSRALIRPQFVREQLANVEVLERHVQSLMRRLQTVNGRTEEVDLVPLLFCLTLDNSTETLFGHSVDSQLAALEQNRDASQSPSDDIQWHNFGPAFDKATAQISSRFRLDSLYWLHNTKALRDACAEVHRFADHFVNSALQSTRHPTEKPTTPPDTSPKPLPYIFLDALAQSTRLPIELRDQALNVLLAGRDTTAGLLSFTFYQLASHPHIYAKLRSTILSDFGTYTHPTPNLDIFAALKSCSYLQHTLSETLRLHPPVPINGRRAVRDTTLPLGGGPDGQSPVFIPANAEVNYCVHAMQRRTDLWGADANEFRPERWVGRKAGWEFLPFNGGPRICLGQQSALVVAGYVVVRMVQRFEGLEGLVPYVLEGGEGGEGEGKWGRRERYWTAVTDAPVHVQVRLREGAQ